MKRLGAVRRRQGLVGMGARQVSLRSCCPAGFGFSGRGRCGATLVEVVALLAVLLGVVVPGLHAARQLSRSEVCLSHLQGLGVAVRTYAGEYDDRLPGPLHPAVYRYQTPENYMDLGYSQTAAEFSVRRQLTWLLRDVAMSEQLAVCPTMDGIIPDAHFDALEQANGYYIWPAHYALNQYGCLPVDSCSSTARVPNPRFYFGWPSFPGAPVGSARAPRHIGEIPNADREWMIADAWYRERASSDWSLLQEGPYQSSWSGGAMPFFAPHGKRGWRDVPVDSTERANAAIAARQAKDDGLTNTLYFDGHVAAVPSRTASVLLPTGESYGDVLYGFPGTVNGDSLSDGASLEWR